MKIVAAENHAMDATESHPTLTSALALSRKLLRIPCALLAEVLEFFAVSVRWSFGALAVLAFCGAFVFRYLISQPVPSSHFWLLISGGTVCTAVVVGYEALIDTLRSVG